MRIKWFTPAVKRLFDVIDSDIGRPIANLAQKFIDGDLVGKGRMAIDALTTTEQEVRGDNGRNYSLRVQPYRTRENRIVGAVASFVDITEMKRAQSQITDARDYAESIVRTVHDPMVVLDGELRVRSANPAFYQFFRAEAKETEGRFIYELGSGQWNIAELRTLLAELLPTSGRIENFEIEHEFPRIGRRWLLLNAQRIVGYGDRPDRILLAFDDASERKQAERHREMLVAELSHRVKNSLTVVQSVATQTLRNSKSLDEFAEAFTGRIQALARAHDIVVSGGFDKIKLAALVQQALSPFGARIEVGHSPAVEFDPAVSQSLTLMLHELATNAVKYGALSTEVGAVSIGWRIDADGDSPRVVLTWTETGGPLVKPPDRTGQGTRFIKGSVRYDLRGDATLDFRAEGLHATITLPLTTPMRPPSTAEKGSADDVD